MGWNNIMHDISKLKPIHQKMYIDFVNSPYTPNEVPDSLYDAMLKLADIPQKDWNKQSTIDAIGQITDRND